MFTLCILTVPPHLVDPHESMTVYMCDANLFEISVNLCFGFSKLIVCVVFTRGHGHLS